jgi:hypothetical protein
MPKKIPGIVRSLSKLEDRLLVKHEIRKRASVRYGVIDTHKGVIRSEGKEYSTLGAFVMDHYGDVYPTRTSADAWAECWAQPGREWVRIMRIPEA